MRVIRLIVMVLLFLAAKSCLGDLDWLYGKPKPSASAGLSRTQDPGSRAYT